MQAIPNVQELLRGRALLNQLKSLIRAATTPGLAIDDNPLMTREQVEKRLMIHKNTLLRWRDDKSVGFPEPFDVGMNTVWFTHEIDEWLAKMGELMIKAKRDGASRAILTNLYGPKVADYLIRETEGAPDVGDV
jgi:predicted DNA-binding transcriptional regulator AlpA